MRALSIAEYGAYHEYIRNQPTELNLLLDTIPINLSYFYRNPEVFDYFRTNLLPRLLDQRSIVFWSAGCASGEEAYSIAICLRETLGDRVTRCRIRILGTDVDQDAVRHAQEGSYGEFALSYLPRSLVERYFRKKNDRYAVIPELKKHTEFSCQDLFGPPPSDKVDVIFCRNVLIYFEKEAQKRLVNIFQGALEPGGHLILGKTEILLGVEGFRVVSTRERVYQKV